MANVLISRHKDILREDATSGDLVYSLSASQGTPRTSGNQRKLGGRPGTDSPSEAPEGTSHAHTLMADFCPPD